MENFPRMSQSFLRFISAFLLSAPRPVAGGRARRRQRARSGLEALSRPLHPALRRQVGRPRRRGERHKSHAPGSCFRAQGSTVAA